MFRIKEIEGTFHKAGLALGLMATCTLAGCACGDGLVVWTPPKASPAFAPIRPQPDALPAGATASFPSFDGDTFTVVLPVRAQGDLPPRQELDALAPVLQAVGFERSLAELGIPDKPLRLPGANLAPLVEEACQEALLDQDETAKKVCAALQGRAPFAPEAAFQIQADVERGVIQYVFPQLVDGIPIESSGLVASRREGESVSSVHGSLYSRFVVTNQVARDRQAVLDAARRRLGRSLGELPEVFGPEPELVMLPYGSRHPEEEGLNQGRYRRPEEGEPSDRRVTALRHAWRTLMGIPGASWMAWIDAATGDVLRLIPQWDHAVSAKGEHWRRDPGLTGPASPTGPTAVADFEVDPASGGRFVLELDDVAPKVFLRFDRFGDNRFDDTNEVSISAAAGATLADFNRSPINDDLAAVCDRGRNPHYRQVHAYSHLFSFWKQTVNAGTILAFPENPVRIWIDRTGTINSAHYDWDPAAGDARSVLQFIAGSGFLSNQCPDKASTTSDAMRLNGVQDVTTLAHEMSHLSVKRLQDRRPAGWCGLPTCPIPSPEGRIVFHDFADAFALSYASTDCVSGWADKNLGGKDASLYCKASSETGGFPRRIEAAKDRFPEHRNLGKGGYADGQIAAAGLWGVRQGMRSKGSVAGTIEFLVRLQGALWDFGLDKPACTSCSGPLRDMTCPAGCDRDVYQYLLTLEEQMVKQWAAAATTATDWRSTANKVSSGWAAAGIFLVPYVCLDNNASTQHVTACPGGEGGGDAVIDVDDQDTTDDLVKDGVRHPEVDYLRRLGPVPRFRIWTGPRFRFDGSGNILATGTPLCHTLYRVEVSLNANFPEGSETQTFEGSTTTCQANVPLPSGIWDKLKGVSGDISIYYRARTWDAAGDKERISTSPGAGAFNVPPPFVVINDSGKP